MMIKLPWLPDSVSGYVDPNRFKTSVHAKAGVTCFDCHSACMEGKHTIPASFAEYYAAQRKRCLDCHEKKTECLECHKHKIGWDPINQFAVSTSVHAKPLKIEYSNECQNCHDRKPDIHYGGNLRQEAKIGANSCFSKDKACHGKEAEAYSEGVHGKVLKSRPRHAPGCVDCHGSHDIKKLKNKTENTISRKDNPFVCGECHKEQLETYLENYHGKTATVFGSKRSATCYDCHNGHQITSLKNRNEAIEACRKCHKKAPEKMGNYVIHAHEDDPRKEPILFGIKSAMTLLLVGTLTAFYIHSGMWFYRKRKERINGDGFGDEF